MHPHAHQAARPGPGRKAIKISRLVALACAALAAGVVEWSATED